jgi:GAF domain-containing protein
LVKEKGQLGRYSSSTLDSVIQEIALIVASTLDINEIYEGFTLKIKGLVDFDRIYIDVLDLETGYYSVNYMSGCLPPDWRPGKSERPQGTQTYTVVSAGQSLIRYDIAQDRRFTDDEDSLTAGLRSSIAVPLVTKGKVIGTLGLQSCRVGAYEAAEQAVLEKLANLIAPSVENATLYQRLQEHAQEMALADEVARVITSTLEIDQVYEQFAQEMKKLVDFDRVVVNVVDEDCRNFTIKYSAGLDYPGRQVGDTSPLEGTQTQYVVTSGQTLVRPDLQADPRFVGDQALLDVGIKSVIVIPLNSKGKVIGVLIANSRWINAFGMREHAILERLAKQIAPAVENSELYHQVQAATQEMALVDEVARIITSTLEIDEVYDQFAREMRKLLDFERMVINSVDPEAGTYTLRYIYGQYRPGRPIGVVTALASSQNEEVVRTGQTLIRNDFASDLRFQSDQELAGLGLRASIMAPLIVKGRIIGTIGLRSRNVAAYGQRERAILERLSKQIAPAIENAELYQMVQESTQEIDLVDQVARIITSTLDIDQVYEKFANEMKKLVDFDRAFVNIVDEEAGTFMIKYVSGIYLADRLPGQVKPLNGSQIDYVVKSGKTLCRSDVAQETMFKADEEQMRWGARSSIAVPLISNGRAIGILGLRSRLLGAYGPREQAILERLASQIAPAIENAELYQQLQASTEEMEVVNEVARIMTSTLHIDQVCEEFAREMRKLVDFERASISMVDRESRTYTPQYVFGGPRSNEPIGSVSPLEGSMTGAVVETGRTLVRRDISSPEGGEFLDDQVHLELGLHSCIALPLISKGQVIGSMILRSRRTNCYGPREQALLERLTRQIAPAWRMPNCMTRPGMKRS